MSTSKYVDKICIAAATLMIVLTILFMFGDKLGITVIHRKEDENTSAMFTENDLNADWDTDSATKIILDGDAAAINGSGAYFSNHILHIVYAGQYVISGSLEGSVQIEADGDDKIWILLDGVDITSQTDAPLSVEQADKVFLTLKEDSQNTLSFQNKEEASEIDGCIFSRDDLTINGKGALTIVSSDHHGIVCNDSLVLAGGNINITAKSDAVHAHDAIKICNASITVSAGDDGLHAMNEEESSIFYLESGRIHITECYEGIEAHEVTIAGGTVDITSTDDGINASGSDASESDASENDATSLITISGGDITIINPNGRDADGLDSNGNINISGGNLFISISGNGTNNAIDYGSENGGKCIITGGTIIACGSSQMAEAPDNASTQGFIMQMVSGKENEVLSVTGSSGKEIVSKEIPCSFSSVIISSPDLSIGDTVKLKIGDNETAITISNVTEDTAPTPMPDNQASPPGLSDGQTRNNPLPDRQGDSPQLSDGQSQSNGMTGNQPAPPEPPDGQAQNDRMTGNQGAPPELSDEQLQNRGMPGNQRSTPPEMLDDNDRGEMEIPGHKPQMTNEGANEANSISSSIWIWLGISALILIIGIFIAIKKKY